METPAFGKCRKNLSNETYKLETPMPKLDTSMVWIGMRGTMKQFNVDAESKLRLSPESYTTVTGCTMYKPT